ncbi:uncharacterized protein LOC131953335 [Physella acuta]|uniref:uncharacterized protein LOC131953335 n=1 Tax=Physella acuta TaxID=109671 RepID=UPI0027DD73B4|nr:uncharacterized protein LOC131953335 [Physella acuta]
MSRKTPVERANYFFCVRVTNPAIHKSIQDALDWILDKDPQYTDFCYTKEMLHVTLCEVKLDTDEEIECARKVLLDLQKDLESNLPKEKLVIKGMTTFFEKVLVAEVEYEQQFRVFADLLKSKLKDAGVKVIENHDFRPHLTVMKVSTMRARRAKVAKINPWLYVHLKTTPFGEQGIHSVHLCRMGYDRRDDGFYVTPAEIFFDQDLD